VRNSKAAIVQRLLEDERRAADAVHPANAA
jgi:hypothetical protein